MNSSKRQGTSSGKRSSSTAKRERPAKRRCVLEGKYLKNGGCITRKHTWSDHCSMSHHVRT